MKAMAVKTRPVRQIESAKQANELARYLLSSDRANVVVVLTTRARETTTPIDPAEVANAVTAGVEVVVLPTGPFSYAFEDELPPKTSVYGGAGRAYPVGTRWVDNLSLAPLRFVWTDAEAPRATELLIEDALAMGREAAPPVRNAPAAPVVINAAIRMIIPPSRAIAVTENGLTVSVRREDVPGVPAEVPLDRIVSSGMKVAGRLDPTTSTMTVEGFASARDLLAVFTSGQVALGQVARVRPDEAAVALVPGVPIKLALDQVSSNPADRLTDLLTVGEVVAVRVQQTGRPDGQLWVLSMLDVDDDEPICTAPSLLPGGPPWLSPDDLLTGGNETGLVAPKPESPTATVVVPAPLVERSVHVATGPVPGPAPDPTVRTELDRVRRELADATRRITALLDDRRTLVREADDLAASNARLEHDAAGLRAQLRKTRTPKVARAAATPEPVGPAFIDPVDQFRHEVYAEWVNRIPAAAKRDRPLAEYSLGEHFLDSLACLGGIDRSKVIAVTVEVLTGLAEAVPGREMHRLRDGAGPTAPAIADERLGSAWRVNLQTRTASARRLHYWRRTNGHITLAKVGVHDDMSI